MKMIVTVGVISTLHICKWKFSSVSSALLVTHNHWCSLPRFTYNQAQWKLKSYLCFCVQFSFFRNENIIVGCRNPRLYQLSSSSLALCAALQVDDMVRQRWGNMFSDLSWRICFTFQKCAYLMYKCHCTCKYHYAQNNNNNNNNLARLISTICFNSRPHLPSKMFLRMSQRHILLSRTHFIFYCLITCFDCIFIWIYFGSLADWYDWYYSRCNRHHLLSVSLLCCSIIKK